MTNCVNDWTPVITILAIQIPIIIGVIGTWVTSRINAERVKGQNAVVTGKVDSLTTLVIDGFRSPTRPTPTLANQGATNEKVLPVEPPIA